MLLLHNIYNKFTSRLAIDKNVHDQSPCLCSGQSTNEEILFVQNINNLLLTQTN